MRLSEIPGDRVILILGAPRSGTSWLAKIFDSHPDVLYRHEPDTVLRNEELPWMCRPEDVGKYRDKAAVYLRQLIDTSTLKTAGSLPIFPKRYQGLIGSFLRTGIIYGLRSAELSGRVRRVARSIRISNHLDLDRHPELRVVIKSVSSRGRARLFAEALPGAYVIFIVRDPFGQVASMLRGAALGKFEDVVSVGEVLQTEQARQYGLTRERFFALPVVEQFAWNWAILNERAINDLADIDTARVLSYQELGADPIGMSRELFTFTGLRWERQTDNFLRRSTNFRGRERYYQVFKDTREAMNRWRKDLSLDDQHRIRAVVQETSLAAFCAEVEG